MKYIVCVIAFLIVSLCVIIVVMGVWKMFTSLVCLVLDKYFQFKARKQRNRYKQKGNLKAVK